MQESKSNIFNPFNIFLTILYLLALSVIVWYLYQGWDFYLTAFSERPHHQDYRLLKPGSLRSHGFGVLGSFMMILLLIYSLRKRTRILGNTGSMKNWLNFHIFLGTMGPVFIILHSTFKLNGVVATSFWSMIAVALSGVLGRFLYLQIPRTLLGNEMSMKDVELVRKNLITEINSAYQFESSQLDIYEKELSGADSDNQGVIKLLFTIIIQDLKTRFKSHKVKNRLIKELKIPKQESEKLVELLKKKVQLERRIHLWNGIHQLFHYWHIFHKPFAVIMYLIMSVHIAVSVWLGYRWIF